MDKLLENVAQELRDYIPRGKDWPVDDAAYVLRRLLLPLLEAGAKAVSQLAPRAYPVHAAIVVEYENAKRAVSR